MRNYIVLALLNFCCLVGCSNDIGEPDSVNDISGTWAAVDDGRSNEYVIIDNGRATWYMPEDDDYGVKFSNGTLYASEIKWYKDRYKCEVKNGELYLDNIYVGLVSVKNEKLYIYEDFYYEEDAEVYHRVKKIK